MALELKKAKDDLAHLIEKAESQKSLLEKEIASLEKTEKDLHDTRSREQKKLHDLEETSQGRPPLNVQPRSSRCRRRSSAKRTRSKSFAPSSRTSA